MVRTLITLGAMALLGTGCSVMGVGESEFACEKNAGECASVAEVYRATNGRAYRSASPARAKAADEGARTIVPAAVTPLNPPNWPAPVLEPASVLRIWVAPWVDDNKALHWPSYIFAEVTPRKWSFGNMDFRETRPLVPIQIDRRKTDDSNAPSSSTTD